MICSLMGKPLSNKITAVDRDRITSRLRAVSFFSIILTVPRAEEPTTRSLHHVTIKL